MTRLFNLALRVFGAKNNSIISDGSRIDNTVKHLTKSKIIKKLSKVKKFAKTKCFKQPIVLSSKASGIFFLINSSN